ncbi:MAG: NADH-quinone oxidoreductase subunit C [Methanoregula sp.]|nr:NADH-quinone oxidoreductase subunit C [Methanoregula sp.]
MIDPLTLNFVTETMKGFGTVEPAGKNRFRITTTPDRLRDAIMHVQAMLGCDRLITVSAVDNSRTLELHYHFTGQHRTVITIATGLSRDKPVLATLSDLLLPAGLYERQIHDLFGISFTGHPSLKKLVLNEDFPENEYPLRKDWKPAPGRSYGGTKERREPL